MKEKSKNNLLDSQDLRGRTEQSIVERVGRLSTEPVLALIWVGSDTQTQKFVKAKQKKASELGIIFQLHHFESMEERQLSAVVTSLASSRAVDAIVVQLPLPNTINSDRVLSLIPEEKDVDSLVGDIYPAPTPTGIVRILEENNIDLSSSKTMILGDGRLVGHPLSQIFKSNNWPFEQINSNADSRIDEIKSCDVLISATGVSGLVKESMVHQDMVVVDGSGIDVEVSKIAPLVRYITPVKGAVGPMTVLVLLENVVSAAERRQGSSK